MPFDMRPLFQALLALWTVVQTVLGFDGNVLAVVNQVIGLNVAFGIFFLAGLSEGYGTRAVTLFLNRLGRRPFFLSLVITSIAYVFGAVLWAFTIDQIGVRVLGTTSQLPAMIQAVAIGYLPLIFAFLAFIPYLGPAILVLLQGVSFILTTIAVSVGFQATLWEGALCTLLGWLLLQALRWFTAGPTTAISRWLLRVISGREVHYNLRDIVPPMPLGLHEQGRTLGEGSRQ